MRFAGWLALLLLVAPDPVRGDNCPPGGCEFSSTTVLPTTTTSSTISVDDAFLQPLLDDIQRAVKLPFTPVVLSGPTFPRRGRLKVRVWSTGGDYVCCALVAKGRVSIPRLGAFNLKLHPTRFGRRFQSTSPIEPLSIRMWFTTSAGTQHRTREFRLYAPGPGCCDFGGLGDVCRGGLDARTCVIMLGTPLLGSVCSASGDCRFAPDTRGSCCDNVPSQPGVCGAPSDAAACVSAGGTFHPASLCQATGVCSP
jgi:hypothetical protein